MTGTGSEKINTDDMVVTHVLDPGCPPNTAYFLNIDWFYPPVAMVEDRLVWATPEEDDD